VGTVIFFCMVWFYFGERKAVTIAFGSAVIGFLLGRLWVLLSSAMQTLKALEQYEGTMITVRISGESLIWDGAAVKAEYAWSVFKSVSKSKKHNLTLLFGNRSYLAVPTSLMSNDALATLAAKVKKHYEIA
jgi:hypothetical protein